MADFFLTKSIDFRIEASRQLRGCAVKLLPAPRTAANKIWVRPPGVDKFLSVVADRLLVVGRNGVTLAIALQSEMSTGLNTSALIGKSMPAISGAVIETRAKLRHNAALVAGPGRPRIHAPERRLVRDLAAVVFVAADPRVGRTIDRIITAFPKTAIRRRVADVNAFTAADRANLIRTVVDLADRLLP
jgi:hypothetical protein